MRSEDGGGGMVSDGAFVSFLNRTQLTLFYIYLLLHVFTAHLGEDGDQGGTVTRSDDSGISKAEFSVLFVDESLWWLLRGRGWS